MLLIHLLLRTFVFLEGKDEYKQLWEKEPYLSRRKDIQNRCKKFQVNNSHIDLQSMIYDDHHNVVWCIIPKVNNCNCTYLINCFPRRKQSDLLVFESSCLLSSCHLSHKMESSCHLPRKMESSCHLPHKMEASHSSFCC